MAPVDWQDVIGEPNLGRGGRRVRRKDDATFAVMHGSNSEEGFKPEKGFSRLSSREWVVAILGASESSCRAFGPGGERQRGGALTT